MTCIEGRNHPCTFSYGLGVVVLVAPRDVWRQQIEIEVALDVAQGDGGVLKLGEALY